MDENHLIQKLVNDVKKGQQLIKEKRFEEGLEAMTPYITLFKQTNKAKPELMVSYAFGQIQTGDLEGFLSTVDHVKGLELKTEKDRLAVEKLDQFLLEFMEELQQAEQH